MNRKLLASLFISIAFLGGCIKDPVVTPRLLLTKWTYVGIGTYKYDYDAEKRLTILTYTPLKGTVSIQHYAEFNAAGAPLYYNHSYAGAPTDMSHYRPEYDASGRLTILRTYDADNNLRERKVYTYSTTNIEQLTYTATGALDLRVVYFINTAGNITSIDYYNAAGVLQQRRNFSLFDDQKSNKWLVPAVEGRYLYSENNYRAYNMYDPFTGITQNFTCVYEYNTDGYVTRRTSTNTATGSTAIQTFEYVIRP